MSRAGGLLAHITSLPGRHGCGDLGPSAYEFLDFLRQSGCCLWQMLPIHPTGYGESPYQSLSTFAGHPLFLSLDRLREEGWLTSQDLKNAPPRMPDDAVDFATLLPWRTELLRAAFESFSTSATAAQRDELDAFRGRARHWLEDYALYRAIKESYGGRPWTEWEPDLVRRTPEALKAARTQFENRIRAEEFLQFQFDRQWRALRAAARDAGIALIGDVPIFVAHDSADVWVHQDQFSLDDHGRPMTVAGVPPDYFSESGQLWGNPLYRWEVMKERGYDWWIARLKHAFDLFDLVRLDHFRGFEAYWEIPATAPTAAFGQWVPGPGAGFFEAVRGACGALPLVAEDLGVITAEVEALRDTVGLPGMRVLQFAFGDDAKAWDYRPHNYIRHCVAYTGTHDNDTTVGWFRSEAGEGTTRSAESIRRERAHVLAYTGTEGREIHWDLIRLAWGSVAERAIAPVQDLLGLGSEARMNLPGTANQNWRWRWQAGALTEEIASRLRGLSTLYERCPGDAASGARTKETGNASS